MTSSSSAHPNNKKEVRVPDYAWVILAVVFFSSIAAPLNQFKVPPIMPILIEAFQLDLGSAGLLMSVFAITGVVLALPSGFILQRLGIKTTGLIALGCLAFGAVMGATAHSVGIILISRVIEGVGMGMMTILAPALITLWFPSKKRGLPMGIWATWVPVGSLIMLILAPLMAETGGWQVVWWIGAGFSILMFVLYAIFIRAPEEYQDNSELSGSKPASVESPGFWKTIAKRDIWLMAFVFGCATFSGLAWSSFFPTFLVSERGFSLSNASLIFSISTVMSIFSCLVAGVISDRIGSRRLVFTLPFIPLAILMPLMFQVHGVWIPFLLFLYGLMGGAIPTAIFAAVPEVMKKPELAGLGLAVITLGQNLGFVFGPAVFGILISRLDWTTASLCIIPIMLLGLVVGWKVEVS